MTGYKRTISIINSKIIIVVAPDTYKGMNMKSFVYAVAVVCFMFVSCADKKPQTVFSSDIVYSQNEYYPSNEQTPEYVKCTMCQGQTAIQYFDGSIIVCPTCGGAGQLPVEYLMSLIDDSAPDHSNGKSPEDIQNEIEWLETRVASMQESLNNIQGEVATMNISSQIIEYQSRIQSLKMLLSY